MHFHLLKLFSLFITIFLVIYQYIIYSLAIYFTSIINIFFIIIHTVCNASNLFRDMVDRTKAGQTLKILICEDFKRLTHKRNKYFGRTEKNYIR